MPEIDTSDLDAWAKRGISAYRRVGQRGLRLVEQGAQELRATDSYQNRTGNLRGGTQAILVEDGATTITVSLEMDEHYASYVIARGYSNFWAVARQVEQWWVTGLETYAERSLA